MPPTWQATSAMQQGSVRLQHAQQTEQEHGYVHVEAVSIQLLGEPVRVVRDAHFLVHETPGAGWGGIVRCDGVRVGLGGVQVLLQDAMDTSGVRKFPAGVLALSEEGALTREIFMTEDKSWQDISCLTKRVYAVHISFWKIYCRVWPRCVSENVYIYTDTAFNFCEQRFCRLVVDGSLHDFIDPGLRLTIHTRDLVSAHKSAIGHSRGCHIGKQVCSLATTHHYSLPPFGTHHYSSLTDVRHCSCLLLMGSLRSIDPLPLPIPYRCTLLNRCPQVSTFKQQSYHSLESLQGYGSVQPVGNSIVHRLSIKDLATAINDVDVHIGRFCNNCLHRLSAPLHHYVLACVLCTCMTAPPCNCMGTPPVSPVTRSAAPTSSCTCMCCRYTFSKYELVGDIEFAHNVANGTIRVTTSREVNKGAAGSDAPLKPPSTPTRRCDPDESLCQRRRTDMDLEGRGIIPTGNEDGVQDVVAEDVIVDGDDTDGGILFELESL